MSSATTTLSTSLSIARFEENINTLTDTNWNDKITVAKDMIKKQILLYINNVDKLDDLEDLDIFGIASDYLVLHLIYTDISKGKTSGTYITKAGQYLQLYKSELNETLDLLNKYNTSETSATSFYSGKLSR